MKLFCDKVLIKLTMFPKNTNPNVRNENLKKLLLNVCLGIWYAAKNRYINENITKKNNGAPIITVLNIIDIDWY
jgi:hypothetical protein